MNASDMLDYALGRLEGSAREQADQEVAADAGLSSKLDRLASSLHHLLDDEEAIVVPKGLTRRTVAFALEGRPQGRRTRSILDFRPVTVPFRWTDVAVAASIFIAGLLTLIPALQRSRDRMNQAGCGYNLQQLGRALWQYGSKHEVYPVGPTKHPASHVGTFALLLHDEGLLNDRSALTCPCNCKSRHQEQLPMPSLEEMAKIRVSDFTYYKKLLTWDYAYNIGYRRPSGKFGPNVAKLSATIPLLADQPPHENGVVALEGNSPNHNGRGQNVLFSDLHVGWYNTRQIGVDPDDMYLNDEKKAAPGVDADDSSLLPSLVPSDGW